MGRTFKRTMATQIHISSVDAYGAVVQSGEIIKGNWAVAPQRFEFSATGNSLLIMVQDAGRIGLYILELQSDAELKTIYKNGTVSDFYALTKGNEGQLLVSSSSFVDSSFYQVVDARGCKDPVTISSGSRTGAKLGLSPSQVSDIFSKAVVNT